MPHSERPFLTDLTFSSLCTYDDAKKMKNSFSASLTESLHETLRYPGDYLKCSCCPRKKNKLNASSNASSILSASSNNNNDRSNEDLKGAYNEQDMEDICVLYKIYLRSSKSINIREWMDSFGSYVGIEDEKVLQ